VVSGFMSLNRALARERMSIRGATNSTDELSVDVAEYECRRRRTEPELVAMRLQRSGLVNRQSAAPPPRVAGARGTGQPLNSRRERSTSRSKTADGRQGSSRSPSANTRHAASLTASASAQQGQSDFRAIQTGTTIEAAYCRGGLAATGQCTAADVAFLRSALAETSKNLKATISQVSSAQFLLKEVKSGQEAETARLVDVFDTLTAENKKLQATARQGWSSTWKLQASLRAQEAEVQLQSEELQEKRKRLELDNACLRKESAAMKSRLLGWQQIQKKGASTGRRQVSPLPKSLAASCSEIVDGAGIVCQQPSSPSSRSTRFTPNNITSAVAASVHSLADGSRGSEMPVSGASAAQTVLTHSGHGQSHDSPFGSLRIAESDSKAMPLVVEDVGDCKNQLQRHCGHLTEDLDGQIPLQVSQDDSSTADSDSHPHQSAD